MFHIPYITMMKSTDLVTVWTAREQQLTEIIKDKQLTLHTQPLF